jgi:hypothetical protein
MSARRSDPVEDSVNFLWGLLKLSAVTLGVLCAIKYLSGGGGC